MRRLALGLVAISAWAQPLTFEVASIRPSKPGEMNWSTSTLPGGRFVSNGATLKMLMTFAYDVREFQISGGPGWINSERFDIAASAATEKTPTDEQFNEMLRSLLADRFRLKVHQETKEMPLYELVIGPKGIKLKEAAAPSGGNIRSGRGRIDAIGIPFPAMAQVLAQILGRPVIDKTGLTSRYDFTLEWAPETGQGVGVPGVPAVTAVGTSDGPTIFTAIQEQLGLRLDSQRGPAEVIVIDQVERPSEN